MDQVVTTGGITGAEPCRHPVNVAGLGGAEAARQASQLRAGGAVLDQAGQLLRLLLVPEHGQHVRLVAAVPSRGRRPLGRASVSGGATRYQHGTDAHGNQHRGE